MGCELYGFQPLIYDSKEEENKNTTKPAISNNGTPQKTWVYHDSMHRLSCRSQQKTNIY